MLLKNDAINKKALRFFGTPKVEGKLLWKFLSIIKKITYLIYVFTESFLSLVPLFDCLTCKNLIYTSWNKKEIKMIKTKRYDEKQKAAKKVLDNIRQNSLFWTRPTDPWCNMLYVLETREKVTDQNLSVEHTLTIYLSLFLNNSILQKGKTVNFWNLYLHGFLIILTDCIIRLMILKQYIFVVWKRHEIFHNKLDNVLY